MYQVLHLTIAEHAGSADSDPVSAVHCHKPLAQCFLMRINRLPARPSQHILKVRSRNTRRNPLLRPISTQQNRLSYTKPDFFQMRRAPIPNLLCMLIRQQQKQLFHWCIPSFSLKHIPQTRLVYPFFFLEIAPNGLQTWRKKRIITSKNPFVRKGRNLSCLKSSPIHKTEN